mmetsp:Transcript_24106/g.40950  ORF Transcript_24106/g.40950 Transcript_24106/m.40950 type:complete len:1178 (-) Transcript_24106:181-3714(-)
MNIFTKTKNTILSSKVPGAVSGGVESIDDMGKAVVSGDIVLMPDEYVNFWTTIVKDRQSCARYMARIVVTLLNFEQDPIKAEKALANKSTIASSNHMINVLLNTIQFIDMFIGFDPKNEAFVSAMEKYELAKKATPSFKNRNIDEGLSGLAKRRGNRGLAAVKMIVECSSLESPEEILHAANVSFKAATFPQKMKSELSLSSFVNDPEDIALEKGSVDFPFTFNGLSRMTKVDISPMIFDELLKQLEGAGSALSSMAHMQGRTLALMFMLREFLTISPTADHMWMQRACLVLVGLYKWPKPYGIVAKDLLDFIHLERRSPGCHLRERIIEENPFFHPTVLLRSHGLTYAPLHPKSKEQNEDEELDSYFCAPSRTCPINFVLLDKSVPLCCTHKHLLLTHTPLFGSGTPQSLSSTNTKGTVSGESTDSPAPSRILSDSERSMARDMRIAIISNAFDTDFVIFPKVDAKSKNKIKDPLGLSSLVETDLIMLYCHVMEVLERAKTLPVNAGLGGERIDVDLSGNPITIPGGLSKLYRESLLGSLLERIMPHKSFAPRRSSDEKVKHVIRQSRRTSLIQQENISDRRSSLVEEAVVDVQGDFIANSRLESKRTAQVLAPDEMDLLEAEDEDEEVNVSSKDLFNVSENSVHDAVLFGQNAPIVPDIQIEVIDVKKKKRSVGEEIDGALTYASCPTKADYEFSTNDAGYLHNKKDVDDLLGIIARAKQEWHINYGRHSSSSVSADMVNLEMQDLKIDDGMISARVENSTSISDDEKLKIKIVLMGSNLVVHRFLSAYVALSTRQEFHLSDYNFEIFIVPQGKNHLGIFLARSDKWYRRHIFDSFKGSMGVCPQYSSTREFSSFDCGELDMQNCLPVKNLRHLMHSYVRQATQKFPFSVYECLCWAAYPEESVSKKKSPSDDSANDMNVFNQKHSHDIIIPFVTQVQLGLLAQLEQFREKPSSMSKLEKQNDKSLSMHSHHEKSELSMRECFADRDAMFNATDLSLQYLPSSIAAPSGNTNKSVHQNAPSPSTIQVDSFSMLSVTNFPCHNVSRDDLSKKGVSAVTLPTEELIMESQLCKGTVADLFANRRKNARSMDAFLESLHDKCTFEHPQHIGAVEINVTNPSDNFHILVDGALYGPFRRLIIRTCTAEGDSPSKVTAESNRSGDEGLTLPIMTYMPLHQ